MGATEGNWTPVFVLVILAADSLLPCKKVPRPAGEKVIVGLWSWPLPSIDGVDDRGKAVVPCCSVLAVPANGEAKAPGVDAATELSFDTKGDGVEGVTKGFVVFKSDV